MRLFVLPKLAAAIVLALSLLPAAASAFDRQITFCNKTLTDVDVAIAYDLAGTSQITSEGWWTTRACTCRTILTANLRATEVFFLVTEKGIENIVDDARAGLCVHRTDSFTYRDQNNSRASCENAGGAWTFFKWKDTGTNSSYRYSVTAPGECNLMHDN